MSIITDKQMSSKPDIKDKWFSSTAIWGHGSLVGRVTPSGERLFYFRYTNSSDQRITHPIGTYGRDGDEGTMTVAEAWKVAQRLAGLHKDGIKDIKEYLLDEIEKQQIETQLAQTQLRNEKAILDSRLRVQDLFDHWLKIDLIQYKDKGVEITRMFNKDVLPIIGHLAIEDVRKGHFTQVTDALLARGVNRMAKQIFSLMRQMFRFAVDRDWLEHDPSASIRKAKIGGKDVERDRVLSPEEISLLNQKLPEAKLLLSTEIAIWIALSTCCRIGELLNASWTDIDFVERKWTIPPENSKNNKRHTIHLSDFAFNYFKKLHALNGHTKWCYPNMDGSEPVCNKTVTKQLSDRQRQSDQSPMSRRSKYCQALILPNGKWTPHDLRRTGATMMTALGVLPEVAERCLNHTEENKVKRTYQRHSYAKEMAAGWDLLGNELLNLTNTSTTKI